MTPNFLTSKLYRPAQSVGRVLFGLLCILLAACASPRESTVAAVEAVHLPDWPASVLEQSLLTGGNPIPLEIAVVVFEPGVTTGDLDEAQYALRSVEARLLTVRLRELLTASRRWGAVRVLPSASAFADVTITGRIEHSDGRDLVLKIRASDAQGRDWLNETYRYTTTLARYDQQSLQRPFDPLFIAVANDLAARAQTLDDKALRTLRTVSRLRYASELVPSAFSDYLSEEAGQFQVLRLPAANDPMLGRVTRIRNQEALFIDTVDEQYVDLRDTVGATYRLWQRSAFEQADYLEQYRDRASGRALTAARGSYAAMQQVYSTYRSVRTQEQDLFELATGFDNETADTVMKAGDRVITLAGTLTQQYADWRRILASILVLERGEAL